MKSFVVAASLLGLTVAALDAKEADSLRNIRSSGDPDGRVVINPDDQPRSGARKSRNASRKSRDFSAERVVPDICTGC